jgi:hypothetical protein
MIRSLLLPFHSISLTERIVETCIIDIADESDKLGITLHCRHEVGRSALPTNQPIVGITPSSPSMRTGYW